MRAALAVALAAAAVACTTRPVVLPRPCDRLDDRPGLRDELQLIKALPGDPWKRTRWYALDSDESCAGNRALGAAPISAEPELSWWELGWLGRLLRF